MSHWGWHSFPLPDGVTPDQIPATGTFQKGRNTGPDNFPPGTGHIRNWMFNNPHRLNLARIRLVKENGAELSRNEIQGLSRKYDLWTGTHTASFTINGQPVQVVTYVHPKTDMVAARIESPLVKNGGLEVLIDFGYPTLGGHWIGDFNKTSGHSTTPAQKQPSGNRAEFQRKVDDTTYHVTLNWNNNATLKPDADKHRLHLVGKNSTTLEFACAFSDKAISANLPNFRTTAKASAERWQHFWKSGGAIDLSGSTDPRWKELERRIVLSQYQMATQSSGSLPAAEVGLMGLDPWRGQFHMEMLWWHIAHYGLWDRWSMAEPALQCYHSFTPVAKALAEQLGYKGLQWGKSVGPEGRSAPWVGNHVLIWKQPHPIFFAELEYRLRPTRKTLQKWQPIVEGTAEYMADYVVRDEKTGIYHLDPVMPPSEQGITRDTVFDLAYWNWGLAQAQTWRKRMGLEPNPRWDEVRKNLAPLPTDNGLYIHSAEWKDSYTNRTWEHPDPVGVFGMLPPMDIVDQKTLHRSLFKIWEKWDWAGRCWGWDFPWVAMCAARLGEPGLAIDALLKDAGNRNNYDQRGVCTGGPCPYLPGNGGLLYATAMMAAGWDGAPDRHAPGFPNDGTWTVRWEGLKKAP